MERFSALKPKQVPHYQSSLPLLTLASGLLLVVRGCDSVPPHGNSARNGKILADAVRLGCMQCLQLIHEDHSFAVNHVSLLYAHFE